MWFEVSFFIDIFILHIFSFNRIFCIKGRNRANWDILNFQGAKIPDIDVHRIFGRFREFMEFWIGRAWEWFFDENGKSKCFCCFMIQVSSLIILWQYIYFLIRNRHCFEKAIFECKEDLCSSKFSNRNLTLLPALLCTILFNLIRLVENKKRAVKNEWHNFGR